MRGSGLVVLKYQSWGACEVLGFLLNGGKVSGKGFFEQADLYAVELLTAAAKLMALEHSHLVRELINLGLAVRQFFSAAADGLLLLLHRGHQSNKEFTQFLRVQLVQ